MEVTVRCGWTPTFLGPQPIFLQPTTALKQPDSNSTIHAQWVKTIGS